MAINPYLFKSLPFDPVNDFQTVTTILKVSFMLVVNPDLPVKSVAALTAYVKAHPKQISSGSGNASVEVAADMYKLLTGIDAVNVRYKGVPQALNDLLGNQIQFMFADVSLGLPLVRAGRLRALAVTSAQRVSTVPELPTMVEAGVTGYEDVSGWMAMFMPAHAPAEVTHKLAGMCNDIMASDAGRALLQRIGSEPFPGSPEASGKYVRTELEKWGRIVKAAGIEPQ